MSPEEQIDLALMRRVRDGDVRAYAALLARHRKSVENFLFRLCWDRQAAEDGAQEVFLRVWAARRRYEPSARFTTYLYKVARNYWLDELRKRQRRPVVLAMDAGEESCGGAPMPAAPKAVDPCYQLLLRYRQRRIQQAISQLPDIHRLAFVLCHLEGCKVSEAAAILDVSEGAVKSRVHTAVRLLRDWLSDEREVEL